MHVASDGDIQASLRLADARYEEVRAEKEAQRRLTRQAKREALEERHLTEDKALRCASKEDKEAGKLKRAREKESTMEQLERDQMVDEDEDSRVRMALLSAKIEAMDAAQDAHLRQFSDPSFHFVPRRKMIQIQSGCISTMCQVLEKNNRTNTWQTKDACVVEQCLSALALHVHRRPERCRELHETKGGVQAIVTGMRECAENRLVQERGLKLIVDTCLAHACCAETFVDAGVLEAIVGVMDRFQQGWHLQMYSCEAISAIVAALPGSNRRLLARVLEVGAQRALGRAIQWHTRSEDVLVAAMQALETITLRCCGVGSGTKNGRASVQDALLTPSGNHADGGDHTINDCDGTTAFSAATSGDGNAFGVRDAFKAKTYESSVTSTAPGSILRDDQDRWVTTDGRGRAGLPELERGEKGGAHIRVINSFRRGCGDGGEDDTEIGVTAVALRLADSYSRDDSRTIVRRAGAARVAASALGLLRALLTDRRGSERPRREVEEEKGGELEDEETGEDEETASLASCVDEFCCEQGVDILITTMDHHIHDVSLLLAGWQAMHSVISIARRKQPLSVSRAGGEDDLAPGAVENESLDRRGERGGVGGVAEALLRRGKNLEQLVSNLARAMDLHQAVAPLQWICLVCLIDLHELEARVSDIFMIRSGCQILHRCIRINARHTAVVEQGCRAVAVLSEPSFTSRTRLFVENIQDAIHQVVFLHRRHRGVHQLGNRALDALWGEDEFGAKQKASAAERLRRSNEKEEG